MRRIVCAGLLMGLVGWGAAAYAATGDVPAGYRDGRGVVVSLNANTMVVNDQIAGPVTIHLRPGYITGPDVRVGDLLLWSCHMNGERCELNYVLMEHPVADGEIPFDIQDIVISEQEWRSVFPDVPYDGAGPITITSEQREAYDAILHRAYAKYHRKRVTFEGIYERGFEHNSINGMWVTWTPGVEQEPFESGFKKASEDLERALEQLPDYRKDQVWYNQAPVRFSGVILAASDIGYGHLNQWPAQIFVEKSELVPPEEILRIRQAIKQWSGVEPVH